MGLFLRLGIPPTQLPSGLLQQQRDGLRRVPAEAMEVMAVRLRRDDQIGEAVLSRWNLRFQLLTSLIYLGAGVFLLYSYSNRVPHPAALFGGVLFVLYGGYRYLLVKRWSRMRSSGSNR